MPVLEVAFNLLSFNDSQAFAIEEFFLKLIYQKQTKKVLFLVY